MRQQYIQKSFRKKSLALIYEMNEILSSYEAQGYILTARQLFYQLVTTNTVENSEKQYKKVAGLCSDARLTGLMDWSMIEDRTRDFVENERWSSGSHIIKAVAEQYHEDLWVDQSVRVFCLIEKDALRGVLEPVCSELDIPILSARGYPSVSVIRSFAVDKILPAVYENQRVVVLHLGDHDPSGIDMTRDLADRLDLFTGRAAEVLRIALNMDQVEELQPPKNPAKMTDTRFDNYVDRYGWSSWELDALKPDYLEQLVRSHAEGFINQDAWNEAVERINVTKVKLQETANQWQEVA